MPVEATTVEYVYTGDGVTTVFDFPSKFTSNADIVVGLDRIEQSSGFTVAGAGASGGGTVTFTTAPAAGSRVALLRRPPASQLVDFVNGQTILEGTLDTALDKLTMVSQYLLREVQKCVRVSEFDPSVIDVLPFAETRANRLLGFSSDGKAVSVVDITDAVAVTEAVDAAAASAASAAVSETNADLSEAATLAHKNAAGVSEVNAATSAAAAAAAAAQSLVNGKIYASTATGLAATSVGGYFSVPAAGATDYLDLYRVDSGPVAVKVKTYSLPDRALYNALAAVQVAGWAFPQSKNLFNPSDAVDGYYCDPTTGNLVANASLSTTGFFRVTPSTTYSLNENCRFIAYYDAAQNIISQNTQNATSFTTPGNAYWARITFSTSVKSQLQIEAGASATAFAAFGPQIQVAYIPRASIDVDKLACFALGKNLFNKNTVTLGYALGVDGGTVANADYDYSDFIPVTPGQTLTSNYAMSFTTFYNESKGLASGGSASSTSTITVPAGVYFVRVTIQHNRLAGFQLEVGASSTAFEAWGYRPSSKLLLTNYAPGSVTQDAIASAAVSPDKTSFFALGKNLFNKNTATLGYFLGHDDSLTANASYDYSDYIAVTPGQSLKSNSNMRFTTFYDTSKSWVSGGSSADTTTITVPAGVYFVRVTISHSNIAGFQLEVGTSSTGFEAWGYRAVSTQLILDTVTVASKWANKAWAALGDSITASGQYQSAVLAALGLVHTNYGVGGTKLSGAAGDANAMCQDTRLNAIPTTIDLLTLMGGMNDWAQSVALGAIGSTDPTTFYGALETFVSKSMARWPGKRVVFLTNTYGEFTSSYASRGWTSPRVNMQGLTPQDYMDAIRKVGLKYCIPVVDTGGNAGWNQYNVSTWVTNESGDHIHPQSIGYTRLAEVIASGLKRIEPAS